MAGIYGVSGLGDVLLLEGLKWICNEGGFHRYFGSGFGVRGFGFGELVLCQVNVVNIQVWCLKFGASSFRSFPSFESLCLGNGGLLVLLGLLLQLSFHFVLFFQNVVFEGIVWTSLQFSALYYQNHSSRVLFAKDDFELINKDFFERKLSY